MFTIAAKVVDNKVSLPVVFFVHILSSHFVILSSLEHHRGPGGMLMDPFRQGGGLGRPGPVGPG